MHFTQLGVVAALATVCHAFLLPPTVTEADIETINSLPFENAVSINDRVMEVNCPGCPVVVSDLEGKIHSAQVESILRLNFSLSHNEYDHDRLLLNDVQIYPYDPLYQSIKKPLVADQLVKSPAGTWEYAASPVLGYSLSVAHPASNNDIDLVTIKLEILEVADKFIHGGDVVVVKLLQTPSGKLMIGDADIVHTIPIVAAPTDSNKECTTMVCKWRAIIADKLSKIKGGCAGKNRHGAHGKHGSGVRPYGHGRPRPHNPHRPHRHHHRHGGFARFVRSIFLHVFIPITIGVVVGVTSSLVGMIIGHFIVFLWRITFRRGQRGQYRRVEEEAVAEDDESTKFLDNQGPPPTYEEAPAYEEAVIDEKTAE